MFYGLVHFPDIDYSKINQLRNKYDPTCRIIDPHITIMFPLPASVGETDLIQHLTTVLKSVTSFSIHMAGFIKSWDHWLFLTLREGNSEVIQLYDQIYSGVLSSYKRSDIPFIPHIGLGLFTKKGADYSLLDPQKVELDQKRYNKALREAESLDLNYKSVLDKVSLLKLNHDLSKVIWRKEMYIIHFIT
jgi:2'-5' RNA ligase